MLLCVVLVKIVVLTNAFPVTYEELLVALPFDESLFGSPTLPEAENNVADSILPFFAVLCMLNVDLGNIVVLCELNIDLGNIVVLCALNIDLGNKLQGLLGVVDNTFD